MHLFTPNFKLYTVLLATETDFSISHKKNTKEVLENDLKHVFFFEQLNHVSEIIF